MCYEGLVLPWREEARGLDVSAFAVRRGREATEQLMEDGRAGSVEEQLKRNGEWAVQKWEK